MRRYGLLILLIFALTFTVQAQDDGLNLPSELYVLSNQGVLQRYGRGASGILTVTPEDAFVLDFAVAPGGNWIAYRTEQGIMLKPVFGDNVTVIEETTASVPPIRGRGDTLAWTPEGDALAYTTLGGLRIFFNSAVPVFTDIVQSNVLHLMWSPDGGFLAAEADNTDPTTTSNFWWIYRRDSTTLTLVAAVPSSTGAAWLDNTRLLFAPDTGGVYTMDMGNANAQTEILDPTTIYSLPFVRPDGTLLVYAQIIPVATTEATEEASAEPEILDSYGILTAFVPDTGQRIETGGQPVELQGVRWSPGGGLIVAFRGGALALVNPTTGQGFVLPVTNTVAYGWGPLPPESVTGIALPADGYFLSDSGTGIAQVWRLPDDGSPPIPLTASETPITEFAISPDGQRVAYVSAGSLWIQDAVADAEPTQLAELQSDSVASPDFSLNGSEIAYVDGGIWIVSAEGGDARQVIEGDYSSPEYAPNIAALLVNVGVQGFGVLDITSGEIRTFGSPGTALWLRDGHILTYDADTLSLWDSTAVDAPVETRQLLPNTFAESALLPQSDSNLRVVFSSIRSGPIPTIITELPTAADAAPETIDTLYITAPQLSPDGNFVAGYLYLREDANGNLRGPLTLSDLDDGDQVIISEPGEVWAFRWGV